MGDGDDAEASEFVLSAADAGQIIAAAQDAGGSQLLVALRQVAAHAIDKDIRASAARAAEKIDANGPEIRSIPAPERPREPARPFREPPRPNRAPAVTRKSKL